MGSETVTYTYNGASQLTDQTNGTWSITHTYDEWGNEITRTTVDGGTTVESYGYNYLNLLSTYSNDTSGADFQYDYWPTGERYAKTDLDTNDKELFVPVGGNVVAEYEEPSGQSIALLNTYVQGLGLDTKYLRISAGGVRRHLLGDQVNTLGRTLDDTGAEIDTLLSDAFGVILAGSTTEPFSGLAQLRPDSESGLSYVRNRMYDPSTGRFTQTDPLLASRATQHYLYGFNNPTGYTDPEGEFPITWRDVKNAFGFRQEAKRRLRRLAQNESGFIGGVANFAYNLLHAGDAPVRAALDPVGTVRSMGSELGRRAKVYAKGAGPSGNLGSGLAALAKDDVETRVEELQEDPSKAVANLTVEAMYALAAGPKGRFDFKNGMPRSPVSSSICKASNNPRSAVLDAAADLDDIHMKHPNPVSSRKLLDPYRRYNGPKPDYGYNPAHDPRSPHFTRGKTPLPVDAEDVYRRAVPDHPATPKHWYGRNADGQIYRFSPTNDGTAHFSGIVGVGRGVRVPKYALIRLQRLQ